MWSPQNSFILGVKWKNRLGQGASPRKQGLVLLLRPRFPVGNGSFLPTTTPIEGPWRWRLERCIGTWREAQKVLFPVPQAAAIPPKPWRTGVLHKPDFKHKNLSVVIFSRNTCIHMPVVYHHWSDSFAIHRVTPCPEEFAAIFGVWFEHWEGHPVTVPEITPVNGF